MPTPETLRRHGLVEGEYEALLEAQGGACAVCGKPPSRAGRPLVIDHDHKLAQKVGRRASVRGLVHSLCNRMLGQLRDSAALAQGLANYLLDPPAQHVLASTPEPTKEAT